jgi:hypothetical protein
MNQSNNITNQSVQKQTREHVPSISDALFDLGESLSEVNVETVDIEKVDLDAKPIELDLETKVEEDIIEPEVKAVIENETKATSGKTETDSKVKKVQELVEITSDNIIKPVITDSPILRKALDFFKHFLNECFIGLGDKLQNIFYIIIGIIVLYIVNKIYSIVKSLEKLGAKLHFQFVIP